MALSTPFRAHGCDLVFADRRNVQHPTSNSPHPMALRGRRRIFAVRRSLSAVFHANVWFGCALFVILAATVAAAQTTNQAFAARAEKAFQRAESDFAAHRTDSAAAINWGARPTISRCWPPIRPARGHCPHRHRGVRGINCARSAIGRRPLLFGDRFRRTGRRAGAPSLAAYRLVQEIEREFKKAAELDETYDHAGPARCLGLLYRDAPGWPLSIGSKRKAREWLERAAALAPDFPENQLNLAESASALARSRRGRKRLEKTRRALAGRQSQAHRRALGTGLGRLDARRTPPWKPSFKKLSSVRRMCHGS